MATYHEQRTVEWGNWGITFMDPNPDATQNYGLIIGSVYFPVGTRGPCNTHDPKWKAMCAAWIADGTVPDDFHTPCAAAAISPADERRQP